MLTLTLVSYHTAREGDSAIAAVGTATTASGNWQTSRPNSSSSSRGTVRRDGSQAGRGSRHRLATGRPSPTLPPLPPTSCQTSQETTGKSRKTLQDSVALLRTETFLCGGDVGLCSRDGKGIS